MAICRIRQLAPERAAACAGTAAILVCIAIGLCCHFKYGRLLTPAGFAVLIFCLSFRTGALDRFLSSRPVMFLGRISFPLYLVHVMPLLWLVSIYHSAPLPPLEATAVVFAYMAGVIGLSALLHQFVERPSQRWIRRQPAPRPVPALGLEGA
jgi:peptidoglycan/LPS O-acetylase OafA/YrhL